MSLIKLFSPGNHGNVSPDLWYIYVVGCKVPFLDYVELYKMVDDVVQIWTRVPILVLEAIYRENRGFVHSRIWNNMFKRDFKIALLKARVNYVNLREVKMDRVKISRIERLLTEFLNNNQGIVFRLRGKTEKIIYDIISRKVKTGDLISTRVVIPKLKNQLENSVVHLCVFPLTRFDLLQTCIVCNTRLEELLPEVDKKNVTLFQLCCSCKDTFEEKINHKIRNWDNDVTDVFSIPIITIINRRLSLLRKLKLKNKKL